MVKTVEKARAFRASIEALAAYAPAEKALESPDAFPVWSADSVSYTAENPQSKVRYEGRLYKCVTAHQSQAAWTPQAVPALWVAIDETHAGTIDNPIPAVRGMEYYKDKYYLDPNGKTYLCIRDRDDAPGSGIVLQYLPSELVGAYFEEVQKP